jgi:hypothetical protein
LVAGAEAEPDAVADLQLACLAIACPTSPFSSSFNALLPVLLSFSSSVATPSSPSANFA